MLQSFWYGHFTAFVLNALRLVLCAIIATIEVYIGLDIDNIESLLDRLYVYLENNIRYEDKQVWERTEKTLLQAFATLKNIKEIIWKTVDKYKK